MAAHGTYSKYTNEKCRCDECRKVNSNRVAKRRAERVKITREKGVPPGVEHNQNTYMNWGCRCEVCKADRSAKDRQRYASKKGETAA